MELNNAYYKYYVPSFHCPVLMLICLQCGSACKKIYGHLIRIYFVSPVLFCKLNMKTWNGQPTTLIEFRFTVYLVIFTPCCAANKTIVRTLLFNIACRNSHTQTILLFGVNELLSSLYISSFRFNTLSDHQENVWPSYTNVKQCWLKFCVKHSFLQFFGIRNVFYNHINIVENIFTPFKTVCFQFNYIDRIKPTKKDIDCIDCALYISLSNRLHWKVSSAMTQTNSHETVIKLHSSY